MPIVILKESIECTYLSMNICVSCTMHLCEPNISYANLIQFSQHCDKTFQNSTPATSNLGNSTLYVFYDETIDMNCQLGGVTGVSKIWKQTCAGLAGCKSKYNILLLRAVFARTHPEHHFLGFRILRVLNYRRSRTVAKRYWWFGQIVKILGSTCTSALLPLLPAFNQCQAMRQSGGLF